MNVKKYKELVDRLAHGLDPEAYREYEIAKSPSVRLRRRRIVELERRLQAANNKAITIAQFVSRMIAASKSDAPSDTQMEA